jgi:ABC-2 type transport system ATP-binding protein
VLDGGTLIAHGTPDQLKQQVGQERLELVFADRNDFERARLAIGGEVLHHDQERCSISVGVDGSARQLKQTLDHMERAGIEIKALSLRRPTLDDVFLALTGHQAAQEAAE